MIPKTGTAKFRSVVLIGLCNNHFAVEYSKQFETTTEKSNRLKTILPCAKNVTKCAKTCHWVIDN
ncbi:MAG: hypothetical protein C4522_18720 [Desulfobacteraceae bacterium]|nr:MAG: hypothetical protein C4522_18720 [Desulfobacteraceae bacterium]